MKCHSREFITIHPVAKSKQREELAGF
ncbi:MAG: hypothetical protein H6Q94_1156, partial [Nitrospirae bacterium]|nr:hypothetical protein [Nitrospirota bacterium]